MILGAYACLGVVFAAPAAAPEFDRFSLQESSGARGDFRILRRTAGGRDAGARDHNCLCVARRQNRCGAGFTVARGMRGVGLDAFLGSQHGHRVDFHQDFAPARPKRWSGWCSWVCSRHSISVPAGFPPWPCAARESRYWLPSCFSWRCGQPVARREPKRMNDVALPDKQGLILRVGLYLLLAVLGISILSRDP